jgi:hypothetical protein
MLRLSSVSAMLLCLSATATYAENRTLTGAEINALLPTVIALGDGTRQIFSAKGATNYTNQGRDSYGSWWVEGDEYCSSWPPAGGYACYAVQLDDAPVDAPDNDRAPILRWVGESGRPTINRLEEKQ